MREILFRGQQRKKGEKVRLDGSPVESSWFYGNGVLQSRGQSSIIYQTEPVFSKHSVYSDTLGQYTGVTDKNGTKIFEGDIVTGYFNHEKIVGYIFYGGNAQFFIQRDGIYGIGLDNSDCWLEVIGNIYDNPELLGKE